MGGLCADSVPCINPGGNDGGIGMLCSSKATGSKADTHGQVGEHGGQE